MGRFDPTAQEVRDLREREGIGMGEGRKKLRRENMIRAVAELREDPSPPADKVDRLIDLVESLILQPV